MGKISYPRTVKSGALAGMIFLTEEEYQEARRGVGAPAEGGPVTKRAAKPKPQFSKDMVAALVKMVEGLCSFIPSFRGSPFTAQETNWLVGDWHDFGKSNVWFRSAVETLFGLTSDGKLVADHLAIFGGRLCTHEVAVDGKVELVRGLVPEAFDSQVRMLASLAYMGRLAMEGGEVGNDTVELAAGRASSPDRENGVGEDLFASDFARA